MNIIKWGFIGCGEVTEKKSGPAFSLIENSKSLTQLIDTLYKNYFNNLIGKCFYYKELDLIIRDADGKNITDYYEFIFK